MDIEGGNIIPKSRDGEVIVHGNHGLKVKAENSQPTKTREICR